MEVFCVPLKSRQRKRSQLVPPKPNPNIFHSPDGKQTIDCAGLRGEPVVVFFGCGCDMQVLDSLDYASVEDMQAQGHRRRLRVIFVPTLGLCEHRWKHLIDSKHCDSIAQELKAFAHLDVFVAAPFIQPVPRHPLVRTLITEGILDEEDDMPIQGQTLTLFQEPNKEGWHFLDSCCLLTYGARCQSRVMRPFSSNSSFCSSLSA